MAQIYTITKKEFLSWLISDIDDVKYWGGRFIKDLKKQGRIAITAEELFHERATLPGHLFKDQFRDGFEYLEEEDISIRIIKMTG
jgi:hypothetical protein